jgi:hypothetical protein
MRSFTDGDQPVNFNNIAAVIALKVGVEEAEESNEESEEEELVAITYTLLLLNLVAVYIFDVELAAILNKIFHVPVGDTQHSNQLLLQPSHQWQKLIAQSMPATPACIPKPIIFDHKVQGFPTLL